MSPARWVLVATSVLASPIAAQLQVPTALGSGQGLQLTNLASDFASDLTVPNSPAFLLLGDEPSTVLRPSTVRELAANISSLIDGSGDLAIPESFGLELSPVLLLGGPRLTRQEFEQKQHLERLRFSVAATRPGADTGTEPRRIAVGFRWGLQDRSDLRSNEEFVDTATVIAEAVNEIYAAARRRAGNPALAPDPLQLTPDEQARVRALSDSVTKIWEQYGWNEPVLDIAGALRWSAAGPDGDSLRVDRWSVWAMRGRPLTEHGQLLYGVTAGGERDPATDAIANRLSATARVYVGSNEAKVFGELQLVLAEENADDAYLLHGGGEVRLVGGGWVSASAGVVRNRETRVHQVVSTLDFRLGIPGF